MWYVSLPRLSVNSHAHFASFIFRLWLRSIDRKTLIKRESRFAIDLSQRGMSIPLSISLVFIWHHKWWEKYFKAPAVEKETFWYSVQKFRDKKNVLMAMSRPDEDTKSLADSTSRKIPQKLKSWASPKGYEMLTSKSCKIKWDLWFEIKKQRWKLKLFAFLGKLLEPQKLINIEKHQFKAWGKLKWKLCRKIFLLFSKFSYKLFCWRRKVFWKVHKRKKFEENSVN